MRLLQSNSNDSCRDAIHLQIRHIGPSRAVKSLQRHTTYSLPAALRALHVHFDRNNAVQHSVLWFRLWDIFSDKREEVRSSQIAAHARVRLKEAQVGDELFGP